MKLSEIAKLIGAEFSGSDREIDSMNTLKDATPTQLSFISNKKYAKDISHSKAAAIIVDAATKEFIPQGCVALVVEDTYWQMAVLSKEFAPALEEYEGEDAKVGENTFVAPTAYLAKGAKIGDNCHIMPGVYVGSNVVIGDNTILYPNVVIYRDCFVGSNCIIHASAVIGGDGFGFASNAKGEHKKIYQNGNAIVEDNVEIGSCTTVDRAVFGTTFIKKGTHLDNLVQIGHNCEVGEGTVIASQSGLAGSSIIGRNNVFGAQSGTAGHLSIAPFNRFAARTGVTKTIKESGKVFAGFPFMDHKTWLKIQGKLARLVR